MERFEVAGTVEAVEQRRYRSGEPIEGLWGVRLATADGSRTVSFNSTVPVDWNVPKGVRRPHPDFTVVRDAMGTGDTVEITGTVANKADIDDLQAIDELRAMAAALLLVADELSELGPDGVARRRQAGTSNVVELDERRTAT
jgi:hypothetical protein